MIPSSAWEFHTRTEWRSPGSRGILEGGSPGPTVAVIGELDSLKVLGHPHADPETDAAHAAATMPRSR